MDCWREVDAGWRLRKLPNRFGVNNLGSKPASSGTCGSLVEEEGAQRARPERNAATGSSCSDGCAEETRRRRRNSADSAMSEIRKTLRQAGVGFSREEIHSGILLEVFFTESKY